MPWLMSAQSRTQRCWQEVVMAIAPNLNLDPSLPANGLGIAPTLIAFAAAYLPTELKEKPLWGLFKALRGGS